VILGEKPDKKDYQSGDRDYKLYVLSDGTDDTDAETRDFLLGP
jgi:hypothetical protein